MNQDKLQDKPRVCKFHVKGNCRFGAKCKYLHEANVQTQNIPTSDEAQRTPGTSGALLSPPAGVVTPPANTSAQSAPVKSIQKVAKPCRGWQVGSCKWADKCRFQHEIKVVLPLTKSENASQSAQPLSPINTTHTLPEPSVNNTTSAQGGRGPPGNGKSEGKRKALHLLPPRPSITPVPEPAPAVSAKNAVTVSVKGHRDAARRLAQEREEAARRIVQEQEEAVRKREEAARIAKQRAAAPEREKQLRLAREREERERARRQQEIEWAKEAAATVQQVIMNSFVKFEAGLAIQYIICGFEASQVAVKNLPVDAKKSEIAELFLQQGIDQQDIVILRTENINGCQQAMVLGKAVDIETVAVGLDGIEFRDKVLEFVVGERERSFDNRTMGSSNRNSYHLNISWRAPPLSVTAVYYSIDVLDVQEKAQSLKNRELNGQRVNIDYPASTHLINEIGRSIQISNIPGNTPMADVEAFAGTPHIQTSNSRAFGRQSTHSSEQIFDTIHAQLRRLPGTSLQSFAFDSNLKPHITSAKAIFGTWGDAKAAYDSLNGGDLGLKQARLRLFLSDPFRFVITLEERQFNAQRNQWTDLCNAKTKGTNIQTRNVDRAGGKRVIITLFGSDKKAVGTLKVRIESLARGQKLDNTYWHPRFTSQEGQRFLCGLYETSGAYVRCDWKHRCITVHGTPEAIETAKSRVKDEVERLSAEEWTIPLQRRALGFFVREGLAKMKGLLGEENVTLNVPSAQIVLRGGDLEEARHHLGQLMEAFADHNAGLAVQSSDDTLCPICYDALSQPVEISCGHIYCSPCLRHYVLSTLDNRSFPLKCMGNDATCNSPFSIPLVKKFLPPQRFDQLVELAFISHLERNPEEFKYCTTPDCSQIYRVTVQPNQLQCPSCFSEVCTACHEEGHPGLTCAERRAQKDTVEQDRLNEAWARDNDVKRCPSCRIWLEKSEGCNHMTCKCGKHICWVCMGIFEPGQIYTHMSQAHGSYYGAPERQAAAARPRNEEPDIVQIAGGPGAVAAQMAELRRIELERANRVEAALRPRPVPPPLPARNGAQLEADRLRQADIAQIIGGPGAVAAQMAEFRRIELERANRVEAALRPRPVPPPLPARNGAQLEADRLRQEEERRRLQRYYELIRERGAEQERLREARERQVREAALEEARRRRAFEEQLRQRRAEKEKSWCIIM